MSATATAICVIVIGNGGGMMRPPLLLTICTSRESARSGARSAEKPCTSRSRLPQGCRDGKTRCLTMTSARQAVRTCASGCALLTAGEVRLEEPESIGHVGPAKADAHMVRLVVDRARKQQDADLGEPRTVPGQVADSRHAREADRARRRANPREGFGVPLEEAVEERQVA